VTGELKFGPVFNFTVRAVPVLLCNNIPSLADLSHGMLRRLMVLPFNRGSPTRTVTLICLSESGLTSCRASSTGPCVGTSGC